MPQRMCIEPGCGALTNATRCNDCEAARNRDRWAKRKSERYGPAYRQARRWWTQVAATTTVNCGRCGRPVGERWDLDHLPDGTLHPSHPACNRAAH